jgi:hypothetical protein
MLSLKEVKGLVIGIAFGNLLEITERGGVVAAHQPADRRRIPRPILESRKRHRLMKA